MRPATELQQAVLLLQRMEFTDAFGLLTELQATVAGGPARGLVASLLALTEFQLGQTQAARSGLAESSLRNRHGMQPWHELAMYWKQRGALEIAISTYRFIIEQVPDFAEVHYNLGLALMRDPSSAVTAFREATRLAPRAAEAYFGLGNALHANGDWEAAVGAFDHVLKRKPDWAEAWLNRGNALFELSRWDDAREAYEESLRRDADQAAALTNLGNAHRELGQLDTATRLYRKALSDHPGSTETLINLGTVLKLQGNLIAAEKTFQRALAVQPGRIETITGLGNVYRELGRLDEARACYRKAEPLLSDGKFYRLRAATLCPRVFATRDEFDAYLDGLSATVSEISRHGARADMHTLVRTATEPPFDLQFHHGNLRPFKQAYAEMFAPSFAGLQCELKRSPTAMDRPRIGMVVTRGHEHIFLRSMLGVLERLDHEQFDVRVLASALTRRLLEPSLQHTRVAVETLPDRFETAVEAVRAADYDVLYYWEVGSDALNYFLPFLRLAPVQCTSWGIQVTSGIPTIDYYISNRWVEPADAERHYSEELILAETPLTYQFSPPQPDAFRSRNDLGFADDDLLYVCSQNIGKIHPDFDPTLQQILQQDGRGKVALLGDDHGVWTARLCDRLRRTMPDVVDRVVVLPRLKRDDYLSLIRAADVVLDPPHFVGVNTTYDTLGLGKVVVTRESAFHRGRYTAGCYRLIGAPQFIQNDLEDYTATAVRLARCGDARGEAEATIRELAPRLFRDHRAVDEHHRIFADLAKVARQSRSS